MIRTGIACAAVALGGYLVTLWVLRPLAAPPPDIQLAAAGSTDDRSRSSPLPSADRGAAASAPQRVDVPPKVQCEGDPKKIPELALARMPFKGGRAQLEHFMKQYPGFVRDARALTQQLLREEQHAAQSCYRQSGPTGPVPVLVEWHLKANAGQFVLSQGTVLQALGDPGMVALARRCLAPMLARSFSAPMPAPPPGEPVATYEGAVPWPIGFGI
jgi:hypothetical protein